MICLTMLGFWRVGVRPFLVATCASACVIGTAGCYNYAPVGFDGLRPGMEIRADITGAGLDRIRRATGQGNFDRLALTGQVVDLSADTVFLGVPLSTFDGAGGSPDLLKPVPLWRGDITQATERRLDRGRTYTAIVVGSFATAFAIYRLRGNGLITPATGTVTPPERRIPLGSIRVR